MVGMLFFVSFLSASQAPSEALQAVLTQDRERLYAITPPEFFDVREHAWTVTPRAPQGHTVRLTIDDAVDVSWEVIGGGVHFLGGKQEPCGVCTPYSTAPLSPDDWPHVEAITAAVQEHGEWLDQHAGCVQRWLLRRPFHPGYIDSTHTVVLSAKGAACSDAPIDWGGVHPCVHGDFEHSLHSTRTCDSSPVP